MRAMRGEGEGGAGEGELRQQREIEELLGIERAKMMGGTGGLHTQTQTRNVNPAGGRCR